jgi:CheY-like chemotaxis protein/phosphohistidine swiveling domain-containing protein
MARVLIVDDELAVRRVVGLAFELEGFEVASASDGAEGIAQVQLFRPDVVIMDIMMPRVDGLTALSHLRQQEATANVPVLLLSAKADSADVAIGMRAGADDYVTKPFELDDLVNRARSLAAAPRHATRARPAATRTATVVAPPPPARVAPAPPSRLAAAVLSGLALFAVLTLAVVAAGLVLAVTGSSPPLWTGGALEVPAAVAAVAVGRRAQRVDIKGTGLGELPVTGRVRRCGSPAEALDRVMVGDILVIDDPSPAYNEVGRLLGGLIVEAGGFSSHAALLARQLGIPALVGASGAFAGLRDGQRVVLDPRKGTVRPA